MVRWGIQDLNKDLDFYFQWRLMLYFKIGQRNYLLVPAVQIPFRPGWLVISFCTLEDEKRRSSL